MEITYDRIDDLLEAVSQRLISVNFRRIGDAPFHSGVRWVATSPHINVMRSRHSPGATFRNSERIKDGDESFSLIYPVRSSLTLSHLGRERRFTAGRAFFTRHDAVCEMGADRNCDFVALVMSPSIMNSAGLLQPAMFAERLPDDTPALKLLKSYVSILSSGEHDVSGEIALSAGRHLSELIHLVVAELNDRQPEPESEDLAATRLSVALSLLRTSFRRPDVSVGSIAAAQNISARYLHRLFEQAGIRFTGHLNELRLTAACEALRQRKDKPITVVAMESGFSDIAHFNRLFKKRFGVTPSAMRGRGA